MFAQHIAIGVNHGVTYGRGENPDCIKERFIKLSGSKCSQSPIAIPKSKVVDDELMVELKSIIPEEFEGKIANARVPSAEPCFLKKIRQGFEKLGNKLAQLGSNKVTQSPSPISPKIHEIYRTIFLGVFLTTTVVRAVYSAVNAALPDLIKVGANRIVGIVGAALSVTYSIFFVAHAIRDWVVQFPSLDSIKKSLPKIFEAVKNLPEKTKDLAANVVNGMLEAYEATKQRFLTLNIVNILRESSFFMGNVSSLIAAFSFLVPGLEWVGIAANFFNFVGNIGDLWQGVLQAGEAVADLIVITAEVLKLSAKDFLRELSAEEKSRLDSRNAELDKKYVEATDKLRSSCARAGKAIWAMLAATASTVFLVLKLGFGISTGIAPAVISVITIAAVAVFIGTLLYPKIRNLIDSLVSKPANDAKAKMVNEIATTIMNNWNKPGGIPKSTALLFPQNDLDKLISLARIGSDFEVRAHIRKVFGIVENERSDSRDNAPAPDSVLQPDKA